MSGPAADVEVRDLRKRFGRPPRAVDAIAGVTFSVGRGEVYGLLGPNGSGKTTSIKILLGLLRPTGGEASVLGLPPGSRPARARIGYMPEESYLYPSLSCRETLDLAGALFGMPRRVRRERAAVLLREVGLDLAADRLVRHLSKGMARRLLLAQALIHDPSVLILDEPTSGLDPVGIREFKDRIRGFRAAGKTILLSSHLLANVQDVCDRIAILVSGRLAREGALGTLLGGRTLEDVFLEVVAPAGGGPPVSRDD
jgi:ABC-2 type transport system ATP-binding protein